MCSLLLLAIYVGFSLRMSAEWSVENTRILTELFVLQVRASNRPGTYLTQNVFEEVAKNFKTRTGLEYTRIFYEVQDPVEIFRAFVCEICIRSMWYYEEYYLYEICGNCDKFHSVKLCESVINFVLCNYTLSTN